MSDNPFDGLWTLAAAFTEADVDGRHTLNESDLLLGALSIRDADPVLMLAEYGVTYASLTGGRAPPPRWGAEPARRPGEVRTNTKERTPAAARILAATAPNSLGGRSPRLADIVLGLLQDEDGAALLTGRGPDAGGLSSAQLAEVVERLRALA